LDQNKPTLLQFQIVKIKAANEILDDAEAFFTQRLPSLYNAMQKMRKRF
jgi:hypothetical protein